MTRNKGLVVVLLALLIAVNVAVYFPSLANGFTNLDDPQLVLNNRDIRGLSGPQIRKLISESYGGLGGYTPLVLLSYALEYRLFGLNARAFHATNLLLHAVNTLLIFWLLYLISGGRWLSFTAAVIFAVHPLHVEPVAWVQGRKDLLFSLFYLTGLICYVRSIQKNRPAFYYCASLLLFGLSIFSKVTAMSFPPVLLLLEKHFTKEIRRPALIRSLPFWAMSGLFFVLAFMTHHPSFSGSPAPPPGFLENLGKFFYAFAFYAGKVFAPVGLFPGYAGDIGQHPWQAAFNVAVLAAVGALFYWAYRRKPALVTFGVGFTVLTLLPTLPFHFFGQPYEDRYMYLPIAGILLILAGLLPEKTFALRPLSREARMAVPVLILITVSLGVVSSRQTRIWHDSDSLWSHVIAKDPSNRIGYIKRAEAMSESDRLPEAMSDLEKAEALSPGNPYIPQKKGSVYFKMGEYKKAMEEYDRSIAINPLFYEGYMSRGILWARLGEYDKAVFDFTTALKLNKTQRAYYYRALAFKDLNRPDQALDDLRSAYAIEPTEQVRLLIRQLSARDPQR